MSGRIERRDIYVCLTGEIIAGYNVGCTLRLAAGTCALKTPSLSTVMTVCRCCHTGPPQRAGWDIQVRDGRDIV